MYMNNPGSFTLMAIFLTGLFVSFIMRDLPGRKPAAGMFLISFALFFFAVLFSSNLPQFAEYSSVTFMLSKLFVAGYGLALLIAICWRYRPEINDKWLYILPLVFLLTDFLLDNEVGEKIYYLAIVHGIGGLIILSRADGRSLADTVLAAILFLWMIFEIGMVSTIMVSAGVENIYGSNLFIAENYASLIIDVAVAFIVFLVASYYQDATDEVEHLHSIDQLTGLLNQKALYEQVTALLAIAKRAKKSSTLIMLEIDDLVRIKDQYGHDTGDRVVVAFAKMLKHQLRIEDLVCRWGHNEFVLILSRTNINEATILMGRLREKINQVRVTTNHGDVEFTASFGLSEIDNEGAIDQAIAEASSALKNTRSHSDEILAAT